MHWPGASFLYLISAALFIVVIPWYVFLEWKEEQNISSKFIFLVIASVAILLPSSLININLQTNYDDGFFVLTENSQKTIECAKKTNEAYLSFYHDSLVYDQLEKVHDNTLTVLRYIDTLKIKMVNTSGGFKVTQQTGSIMNFKLILHPFNLGSAQIRLSPGSDTRNEIDSLLNGYVHEMKRKTDLLNLSLVQSLPRITALLPDKNDSQEASAMITGLHTLNMIEVAVLAAESDVLKSMTMNPDKKNNF